MRGFGERERVGLIVLGVVVILLIVGGWLISPPRVSDTGCDILKEYMADSQIASDTAQGDTVITGHQVKKERNHRKARKKGATSSGRKKRSRSNSPAPRERNYRDEPL